MKPDFSAVPALLTEDLAHLQMLHLADSALPIGSLAHSFGLESLVSAEILQVNDLPNFLQGYLEEAGMLEAVALREAFQLTAGNSPVFLPARWIAINDLLSALKPARESRTASATLGRNFLRAAMGVAESTVPPAGVGVFGGGGKPDSSFRCIRPGERSAWIR